MKQIKVEPDRLNEARWAACNFDMRHGHVHTDEGRTELADKIIGVYLGWSPRDDREEWEAELKRIGADGGE